MTPTRILLVDDYPVVLRGLKEVLLEGIPDAAFGEAADGGGAVKEVERADWDAVILDISLPDTSGLEVLKQLHALRPTLPVLVLSMYSEEQFAMRVLRAGAAGYMTKKAASKELVEAVRKVVSGGKYVSSSLAERLASAIELRPDDSRAPHETLSDREYQVFRMLAVGMTVKDVAEKLALTPQTVSTHRTRILEKMAMASNTELVQYAIQNGLLG